MATGIFHRAAMAVVLIASLLVPYARCQSASRAAAHECCQQHSAPALSLKASCCTIRSELPAIVVERAVVSPGMVDMPSGFGPAATPTITVEATATTAIAQYSPPPGKSVLRI